MKVCRGKCVWVGEPIEDVIAYLEAEGYTVLREAEIETYTHFSTLVCIHQHRKPTLAAQRKLEELQSKNIAIAVWTDAANVRAWQRSGVDAALTTTELEDCQPVLELITKTVDLQMRSKAEKDKFEKSEDDLVTTIESLELASRRFETLFAGLPVACFTFDVMGQIHEWNAMSTHVFGIESYMAFFNNVAEVLDPENRGFWNAELITKIFSNDQGAEFDWSFTREDGKEVHLACKILCLTNRKGEVVAAVAGNLDITERVVAQRKVEEQVREIKSYLKVMERQRLKLQEANRLLRRLAVTDGLTGLMNRRRFNELLDETLDRAVRQNHIFSLILFDIDFFKKLNDEFGHNAGDEILVKFADVLRTSARRYERPARYGGEEFAIILDHCDASGSRLAAERFRASVLAVDWPYRDITVSVGCSTFTGVESTRTMIEHADEALYFAKSRGRNRVAHYRDIHRDQGDQSILRIA